MSYTKRFFGFSAALAVAATAQLAAWPQPAAADPAAAPVAAPVAEAAVASSEPEPLSAKDRKYLEDIGTAAAEVIEDCYADSENERDPHTAPDWCEQKANTVAKAVAKRPSLAAEVLVYAAYERGGRVDGSSFEPVAKPLAKAVDRSAWLAMLDGKTPSGKALPRLVYLVHCAGQAKLADPEALLVRRGWLAGLPAWQAAVKNVAVGRCGS